MILQRRLATITFTPEMERLHIAGLIRKKKVGQQGYTEFNSWYTELLVHLHVDELGLSDSEVQGVDIDEFMPHTSMICVEAYRLINEIENLTRNYIAAQMCLQSEPGFHYLMGRARKYNPDKQIDEDAYERAEDFQKRSSLRGMQVELNPLIAYLSTRDLANLVEEMGAKMQSREWLRISQAIRSLSDVRDAVMHNQLIDDEALVQIYNLRAQIYSTLGEPRLIDASKRGGSLL
jgi:hypothetical protein